MADFIARKGMTGKEMRQGFSKKKRKMTQKEDDAYDKKHGIKEGSKKDLIQDAKNGIKDKKQKKLTSEARNDLPNSAFVFPGQRRYPIHDINHAKNALARSSGKPEEAQVRAAVYKRYPGLKNA